MTGASRTLRLFIAIELPEAVRERIQEAIADLRVRGLNGLRWVGPEGIHLTLKFLGATPEERIGGIANAMSLASTDIDPFALRVAGAGTFPNLRLPRVLWLGLDGNVEQLKQLQAKLEQALQGAGFPREDRRFFPHLTLARINGRLSQGQLETLALAVERLHSLEFPEIPAQAVSLMESQLGSDGARYVQKFQVSLIGHLA